MAEGGEKSHQRKRRSSYGLIPPFFSELNVILLGNSSSLKNSVRSLLLKKTQLKPKHKTQNFQTYNGEMNGQPFTVIDTSDLQHSYRLDFNKYVKALTGRLVFLLVLQPEDFTEKHKDKLKSLLESFSEKAFDQTLVLISTILPETSKVLMRYIDYPHIKDFIAKCNGRYLYINATEEAPKQKELKKEELFRIISQMLLENRDKKLSTGQSQEEDSGLSRSVRKDEKLCLNLVLCGAAAAEKSAVLKSMFGQISESISSDQCERVQGEVCGRWVTVVQLPPLSDKPVETLSQDCHSCMSLCGPQGVQAFILVLPLGPFTDEDKSELKIIRDMFSPAVHLFTVFLFTVDSDHTAPDVADSIKANKEVQELCGGRYLIYNTRGQQQVSELIEFVETQRAHNGSQSYTMKTLFQGMKMITDQLRESQDLRNKKPVNGPEASDCLRIALMGKTGCGKSSSGNTILGRAEFEAKMSATPVTHSCAKAETEVNGRRVVVVDTPGLFDNTLPNDDVIDEMCKCVSMLSPGPHVFLLVIQIGRFTREEQDTVQLIQKTFGKESQKYTMILFTRGDDLEGSIEDFIKDKDSSLQKLVSDFGNRFHVFNNKDETNRSQVKELIEKIDVMVQQNGGDCYTNEMFQNTEASIRKEMERIMKEREEEMRREREELERKHQQEMEEMKQEMENQKEQTEREREQREQELREKEEIIKKEQELRKREQEKRDEEERKWREQEEHQRQEWDKKQKELEEKIKSESESKKAVDQKLEESRRKMEEEKEKWEKEREEWWKKRKEEHEEGQQKLKALQEEYDGKIKEDQEKRREEDRIRKEQEEEKMKELEEKHEREIKESKERSEREARARAEEEFQKKEKQKMEEHRKSLNNMVRCICMKNSNFTKINKKLKEHEEKMRRETDEEKKQQLQKDQDKELSELFQEMLEEGEDSTAYRGLKWALSPLPHLIHRMIFD